MEGKPKARHEKLPIAESYSFHMSVVLLYHFEFESTVFFLQGPLFAFVILVSVE